MTGLWRYQSFLLIQEQSKHKIHFSKHKFTCPENETKRKTNEIQSDKEDFSSAVFSLYLKCVCEQKEES